MVPRSKESVAHAQQRTRITEYLAAQILPNHVSPRDRISFYRQKPVEDPDFEEMYEAAGGDPSLYAILVHQQAARDELEEAQRDLGEAGPSAYRARPEKVAQAQENLKSLKLLELQYRFPDEYPFNSGDVAI